MGERPQNQEMRDVNGNAQQSQAGRDVFAFQNSPEARVIIQKSFISLFGGKSEHLGIDWDWGIQILKQQQPDIKKRLKDSLLGLAEVDAIEVKAMRQEDSPELLLESIKSVTVTGTEEKILDPREPIIATYARQDIQGKLLILGTPGAGKTITLLKLAEQLVGEAIENPNTIIPIIFELSTWRDGQEIETWLINQLYENYGGNRKRKIYENWLERRVLLPLLDGLDELGLVRQRSCTEKVNEFAKTYPKVVVCCRVKEFQQAGGNLSNLRGKVQLQPLSDRQIKLYLQQLGRSGLWEQIQSEPEMLQLLEPVIDDKNIDYSEPGLFRVPLFISLAAQVYEPNKPLKGKADLFERYIDRQLSFDVRASDRDRKEFKGRWWAFKKVKNESNRLLVRNSLEWIGLQLRRNQVELLIEKIQPAWLDLPEVNRRYRMLVGIIFGLLGGVIAGLTFGITFGIVGGIVTALIVRYVGEADDIKTVEEFRFSTTGEVRQKFFKCLRQWLFWGLTAGVIFGLIAGLISNLIFGLIGGLIFGVTLGLIFGLIFGLITALKQELKTRDNPNQGIWNSLRSAILVIFFSYPVAIFAIAGMTILPGEISIAILDGKSLSFIATIVQISITESLVTAISGALVFGILIGGGKACIQHLCLRIILVLCHKIPWNLARFLTYCHERRLLQQIGGRYRFIHRELLEHFAGMEK